MQLTKVQKFNISVLLIIVPFLMGIGVDLYVPSLPAIMKYYGVSSHSTQATIGLYVLGYAIGQIVLGILSDSLGRRKILVLSGLFYTIVSLLASFSPNIYFLIVYRFLQGIGIAGLGVVSRAIATDCFSGLDLTKALTNFSMSWALGPILGPFIGGYIQHYFNWHADFYLFTVYGASIFIFALFTVAETKHDKTQLNPRAIASTIKSMISHKSFMLGSIIASLAYSMLVVFNVIGPFLVQVVLKYSAVYYGYIALGLGIGYFLGNTFNRFIINYLSPLKVILIGIASSFTLSIIMLILAVSIKMTIWPIIIPSFLIFFLTGLILPNMVSHCVSLFANLGGTVNALVGSLTAGGVFLMTSIAALFKTQSQQPLALLYAIMMLISLLLFTMFNHLNNKRGNSDER